ncbi:SRPBCC family protein [Rhodoligotrophos defluvii]|uniref:SRPBCC family protein n=1 Tax=Rhodoligotrophos defluvii TaxID=2561934 RepID=UPI0010C95AE8|nr:SRPBCC domain-containing protein [Rhodoligotrophos defluvii]
MSRPDSDAEQPSVVVECVLDASPEKVWRALTEPQLASDWLDAQPSFGTKRDDAERTFEIIAAQPFVAVSYRWREAADGPLSETVVTVELAPCSDGGTHFRLVHMPAPIQAANGNAPPMLLAA